jgi:hypothetical protein
MKGFATDVLGLRAQKDEPEFSVYSLPDGDVLEIFGPKAIAEGHQFMSAPVAGFLVDDVRSARQEMEAKGILFIGPVHSDPKYGLWSHFFAPDGHVYEITSRAR